MLSAPFMICNNVVVSEIKTQKDKLTEVNVSKFIE